MSGYDALRADAASLDLSARGKIRATGEDRARLLHGMCTNHILGLPPGDGVYAFFLNAQGRILMDAYIYNLGGSLFLDAEPAVGEKLRDHLDRFIIADDVELHDEGGVWAEAGLEGPRSLEYASRMGVPVPVTEAGILHWNDGFVARVSVTGGNGLRIFVPVAELAHLQSTFDEWGIPQATAGEAEVVRLENGKPRYGADISERFLVQETGLLHGVHSNKGCYVGQEIVERVRSRAQLHRQLRRVRISGEQAPQPGVKLKAANRDAGEVTSAGYSPALRQVVGLAYVRTEVATEDLEIELEGFSSAVKVLLV